MHSSQIPHPRTASMALFYENEGISLIVWFLTKKCTRPVQVTRWCPPRQKIKPTGDIPGGKFGHWGPVGIPGQNPNQPAVRRVSPKLNRISTKFG